MPWRAERSSVPLTRTPLRCSPLAAAVLALGMASAILLSWRGEHPNSADNGGPLAFRAPLRPRQLQFATSSADRHGRGRRGECPGLRSRSHAHGAKTCRQSVRATADQVEDEAAGVASLRRYFEAWNERDMATACDQFADECTYEDTQYAGAFAGKDALKAHLIKVADALPPSFRFCIDEVADGGATIGVQWHVENDGVPLPFTRGCSMYTVDVATGKIISGFDVPEPAPFKPGSASLGLLSLASKLIQDPLRAIPLLCWVAYVVIVFFSNGILPGPDATQLDPATWQEVLNLSLNFWLVAPLLQLPFAPVVHPGLEAIFNLLLAWAAAFAGFLVDGRRGRPSGSMLPVVLGMQFLTNAFYLPYLVYRTPEDGSLAYSEDFEGAEAAVGESRVLGPLLAGVGIGAVLWGLFARPEFGDLPTRWASLCELLSQDRLASSFVVDLILFALFQAWLVDDDLQRRGVGKEEAGGLRALVRFVPFLGLCAYLLLRPPLPRGDSSAAEVRR